MVDYKKKRACQVVNSPFRRQKMKVKVDEKLEKYLELARKMKISAICACFKDLFLNTTDDREMGKTATIQAYSNQTNLIHCVHRLDSSLFLKKKKKQCFLRHFILTLNK